MFDPFRQICLQVSSKYNSAHCNAKEFQHVGVQAERKTDREEVMQTKLKVLGMRLKRREKKIGYMNTVIRMIKTLVKGSEMEYKLCCELHKISEMSEPSIGVKKITKGKRLDKAGTHANDTDNKHSDEWESSGDDTGMCVERARLTKKYDGRVDVAKGLESMEVEEVFSSKSKERPQFIMGDKARKSRCTYYRPSNTDFGQLTDDRPNDNYQHHLQEQFGFEPLVPERVDQLKQFKALFSNYNTLPEDGSPQHACVVQAPPVRIDAFSDTQEEIWQNVDTTDDLDRYMHRRDAEVQNDFLLPHEFASESVTSTTRNNNVQKVSSFPKNIRISKVPRVKVIAEKYSKFKQNDVELRKLEDKVVCLEYDIFNRDAESSKPFQKMRAFFSIKPVKKGNINGNGEVIKVPSDVKRLFVMMDDVNLNKFDRKEIEIIDGKIPENRSLLEDLKKVLRRKRAVQNKKKRATLDLMSMYEMAKLQKPTLDADYSNTNLLSKAELEEIKDLIVTRCGSSVHGISRRKFKSSVKNDSGDNDALMLSESMIAELMREPEKEV